MRRVPPRRLLALAAPLLVAYTPPRAAPGESLPDWLGAAFPFFFAAMWILVTTLLAWISGHMTLVARYPPAEDQLEETFGWASGSMRFVGYNSALYVGIGEQGLHLAANALFRPVFHRRIPCIPWREIRLVRIQPDGIRRWFVASKFEIPAVGLRFAIQGAPGRAIERKLSARVRGDAPAPRSRLVRER